ncbi:MAG: aspartate kinase [Cyclobacteriaceae bacterium]|nr:aspartate kinase [Cyclobacteriaceae bacterium]
MKVFKFGGTSVGLPERMHKIASLILADGERKLVVLSAVAGTTNTLVEIDSALRTGDVDKAGTIVDSLKKKYNTFIAGLLQSKHLINDSLDHVNSIFQTIENTFKRPYEKTVEKIILAQGELISTYLFQKLMEEKGINSVLLSAFDFMSIDEQDEPEIDKISEKLKKLLSHYPDAPLFITQGYICLNAQGEIDNLKRGGSDYTASLVGAAILSEEVQIWTDIDGLHNNDPRIVKETYPIAELSFDEAAELAYFGAKILHPSSIIPAQKYNIPVRLKSTLDEKAPGTLISKSSVKGNVKAIAVKDGITAIKIKSTRMLLAHGFLRKIFEIFEKYKTSIDMITTSEVAVSLSIDNATHLEAIRKELEGYGFVEVDHNQSIICIVGNMVSENKGVVRKVFNALSDIPLRMVSYGGSRFNISMLIDTNYKVEALNNLNTGLFEVLE